MAAFFFQSPNMVDGDAPKSPSLFGPATGEDGAQHIHRVWSCGLIAGATRDWHMRFDLDAVEGSAVTARLSAHYSS